MNRRIYYDGALINKIGIDRIVIKKVVLKEINAEKLDTALTCCAIHYDKVIVECIFRKNRALAPHERSAVPLGTDHCPVG